MMGIGVHVCEDCGQVWDTVGLYLDCVESHEDELNLVHMIPADEDDDQESW